MRSQGGERMASPSNKMSNKMIALCSAAVGIVYAAGYYVTLPAASDSGASATLVSTKPAPKNSIYKDGTYTGRGSNRIGAVTVAVTIKNDRIMDVQITQCTTHYSQSLIDRLPDQVLANQAAAVDVVSGATLSTRDFQTAVQQALDQARIG